MNEQLMLRTYSPNAFNWLMTGCHEDTNRRYDSNRERCDLEGNLLPKQCTVQNDGSMKIPVNAYCCRFR